jgi:hypothetical protein
MLTGSLSLTFDATNKKTSDFSTPTETIKLAIAKAIADGTGVNQANRAFFDTRTLSGTTSENISMFSILGSPDNVGQTYAITRVYALIIENKNLVAGNFILVGGEGSSAAWKSPFNGSATEKLKVEPGGVLILLAPSAAGYVVANTTNHLLKIDCPGATAVDYNIGVVGSQ